MPRQIITTPSAPSSPLFSQGVKAGSQVFISAGATLDDVVDVGVLLTDPGDFGGMNEEYARWFPSGPPARSAAKLGAEIPGLLVSIRMTACLA